MVSGSTIDNAQPAQHLPAAAPNVSFSQLTPMVDIELYTTCASETHPDVGQALRFEL